MVAIRTSIRRPNRTTALLGRVLLCLALLLSFSIFALEDLHWSAADQVLDEHRGPLAPMVAKTGDHSNPSEAVKEKHNPESGCWLYTWRLFHHQSPPTLSVQHHRASPAFKSLLFNAPFPPRSPTA